MVNNLHVLFFLYKSKTNEKGTTPIFCRITLDKKRKQFSTGHFVKEPNWNSVSQRCRGNSYDARRINGSLENIRLKLYQSFESLIKERQSFQVDDVYNHYAGKYKVYKTILEAFEYHNIKMKELVGIDFVKATHDKFVVIQNHVMDFLKYSYSVSDYPLADIKLKFLHDLDHYLKVHKGLNQNTINKIIERVKKVVKVSVGNGWISSDPFILYKKKAYTKEVVFLSQPELTQLETHHFAQARLDAVRDCFIFSCYTGLAYNEASLLNSNHLSSDTAGAVWIEMTRQKTQRPIAVPLLPQAMRILIKYGYPDNSSRLLPIVSNQKMNSYLKEIGEITGISKNLTHHVARKTFASTVLLGNDVPLDIVSSLLGHSRTTTTEQHYAKTVKESVLRHVSELCKRLK